MIVDASVAIPWIVDTPFSPSAHALRPHAAIGPSLLCVEAAHVLFKYKRMLYPLLDVAATIRTLRIIVPRLVDDLVLLPDAISLAQRTDHKLYDCIYLSLALRENAPLATADRRLATIAQSLSISVNLVEDRS